ncbi:MGDG synthase family glycosyltransferase [Aneurinibacillus tyrosinisolvens]|uniref:MGDG synthase family glycosyltransferase n=1 Tax=Aneurinibacillus tyrosinisolvens TaxID=1443435 RepID=UPI00063F256A|nr:glycosyltransferase [Aneurinibacillus tyrosinisolvens]
MLPKNRILILYSNYGEGHLQAARAIQEAAERKEGWQATLLDMMECSHPWVHSISQPLFIKGVSSFPRLYGHLYKITKKQDTPYLVKQFLRTGLKRMKMWLDEVNPTMVISTFPFAAAAMSLMKAYGLTSIPTATLITDYCDHRSWIHPYTDRYFVGSRDVFNDLSEKWVSQDRIRITGIPVRPVFQRQYNVSSLKQQLGLRTDLPTLLVMGGGYGMIGDGVYGALESMDKMLQVIIICGKNEKRRRNMEETFAHSKHHVLTKGYVYNIHEWMAASDLLLTKPGGSTISEALSMNLPMLLYQALPGQEQANADFLCRCRVAIEAKNNRELGYWLDSMISHPSLRTTMKQRMRDFHASSSTDQILEQITQFA